MEDLFLYIILALGGALLLQRKKIRNLENEAVDARDVVLADKQEKIQEEKKEIEEKVKTLKPTPVNKEQSAEEFWKDKI